jgi:hypothetical protein
MDKTMGPRLLFSVLGLIALAATSCTGTRPESSRSSEPTTSTPAASGTPCDPDQYAYELTTNGAQGALILDGHVRYVRGAPCGISDRVTVRLMDAAGHLLRVSGNPATTTLEATVGSAATESVHPVLYAWRNWCVTGTTAFSFSVVSTTKSSAYMWSDGEPSCADTSKPSTLKPFTEQG